MANISFTAGNRRRKLCRRPGSNGGPWYVRFQLNGKEILHSTGTTDEATAKLNAKKFIEESMSGNVEATRAMKLRSDYSTLREICNVFIHKFSDGATQTGKQGRGWRGGRRRSLSSALRYIGALERIVRVVTGRKLEDARASILTAELIRKFEAEEVKRIERDRAGFHKFASEQRIRISIGSWVRAARSICRTLHHSNLWLSKRHGRVCRGWPPSVWR